MSRSLVPIPTDKLKVGKLVHVVGWNPATVFRLLAVDGEEATVETPKTRRPYKVRASQLAYTRKGEPT